MEILKNRKCRALIVLGIVVSLVTLIVVLTGLHVHDSALYATTTSNALMLRPTIHPVPTHEIHKDQSRGDFSSNVYARLLYEYVDTMDSVGCYVCMQLPASVSAGVTYHHLPLTYGITCSILMTQFYDQEFIQYFYSNYDVVFAELPVSMHLSKKWIYKVVERGDNMGSYVKPKTNFNRVHAHRNNLTCIVGKVEKLFLEHVEERFIKARLAAQHSPKQGSWTGHEQATHKAGTLGALNLDRSRKGRLCIHQKDDYYYKNYVGWSECEDSMSGWALYYNGHYPAIPGIYYICGQKAYFRLPPYWTGSCYLGVVFPRVFHTKHLDPTTWDTGVVRNKRSYSAGEVVGDIFGALIPSVGVILNDVKIRKLATVVDKLTISTANSLLLINTELNAIRAMVLQNRLALDVLLAKEGGVCKMLRIQQCCTYIPDNSKQILKEVNNMTLLHKELEELSAPGAWEAIGKGFHSIGAWFGNLGSGIRNFIKVIITLGVVVIVGLVCYRFYACFRKRRSSKNRRFGMESTYLELKRKEALRMDDTLTMGA